MTLSPRPRRAMKSSRVVRNYDKDQTFEVANGDNCVVVIVTPRLGVDVFTPKQARKLGMALIQQAHASEQNTGE